MTVQERLRNRNVPYGWLELADKAADEIERLRATLTKIQYLEASNADTWIWTAQETAREALAHEQNVSKGGNDVG